jgi:hypothetical protein
MAQGMRVRRSPLTGSRRVAALVLAALLLSLVGGVRSADGRNKSKGAEFKYVGGTEDVPANCGGRVELGQRALTYRCQEHVIVIPYASVQHMQYRNNISKEILGLGLKWKVAPELERVKANRYFTVEYQEGGGIHVMVFDVNSEVMIPYFAEIDLKSGKRVEVRGYEEYD